MEKTNRRETIRAIYFYLASFVGLILIVSAGIQLIKLGLNTWVFKQADQVFMYPLPAPEAEEEKISFEEKEFARQERIEYEQKERSGQRQRTATNAIAMLLVGIPLYFYHSKSIQKDKRDNA